jgi:hypothetical protein
MVYQSMVRFLTQKKAEMHLYPKLNSNPRSQYLGVPSPWATSTVPLTGSNIILQSDRICYCCLFLINIEIDEWIFFLRGGGDLQITVTNAYCFCRSVRRKGEKEHIVFRPSSEELAGSSETSIVLFLNAALYPQHTQSRLYSSEN